MFNVGGGEIVVILLIALVFLGPEKLPSTAKQVGKVMGELRRMSNGFQAELRDAMNVTAEPTVASGGTGPSLPPLDATTAATPAAEPSPSPAAPAAGGSPAADAGRSAAADLHVEGPSGSFS